MRALGVLVAAVALLATAAVATDCGSGCGGCKAGRCDVFGCPAGLYCCTDLLNGYGGCCATCKGHSLVPTPAPTTPGPSKCPAGYYTGRAWFPWSHPKKCGKQTWAMWGCSKILNGLVSNVTADLCATTVTPYFVAKCTAEMAAVEDELPMFGPEAIAGGLGVDFIGCSFKAVAVGWLCKEAAGKINDEIKTHFVNKACGAFSDLLHPSTWWLRANAGQYQYQYLDSNNVVVNDDAADSTVKPYGFPPEFEATVNTTVNGGNPITITRFAYDASTGTFNQRETNMATGKSYTLKRTLPTSNASDAAPGCGVWWNSTTCRVAQGEEFALAAGSVLPQNFLSLFIHGVLNITAPLQYGGNYTLPSGTVVRTFTAPASALPSNLTFEYVETVTSDGVARPARISMTAMPNSSEVRYVFGDFATTIDPSDWTVASHCAVSEDSSSSKGGACAFTCEKMAWGRCPGKESNGTYGLVPSPQSGYGKCAAELSYPAMCPLRFPYCIDASVGAGPCSTVPYLCPNVTSGKPYMCGAGYPCCDYAGGNKCHTGPCTKQYPAALESPHAVGSDGSGDEEGLPPVVNGLANAGAQPWRFELP